MPNIQVSEEFLAKHKKELEAEQKQIEEEKKEKERLSIKIKSIGGKVLHTHYVKTKEELDDVYEIKRAVTMAESLRGAKLENMDLSYIKFRGKTIYAASFKNMYKTSLTL